jgi:hypothetical protein
MWIMLSDSFLSVVEHPKSQALMVRARKAGDIEQVFPNARVHRTPQRDYGFRAILSREAVAKALAQRVRDIDYRSFKDSVADSERYDAYLSVWSTMLGWARGRYARREPRASIPPWEGDWALSCDVEER